MEMKRAMHHEHSFRTCDTRTDDFDPGGPSTSGQQAPDPVWNVLTDEWFKGENIAGSRRVPLDKLGGEVRGTNLPRNTEIVVYCGGPKCPQSRMAAEKLFKLGYENVRAYEGGLEEWNAAG
jgi:rhodanese-related sulfurtransferase